nr:MAG TPA: hypothetical protein [Caudoviricetes sp.]
MHSYVITTIPATDHYNDTCVTYGIFKVLCVSLCS